MVIASYAASRRVVLLLMAALSPVVVLVSGVIDLLTTPQGPIRGVLLVVFVGIGAFFAYRFGFREIYLVELTPVELRWRQALRGGAAPVGDVQSIRCSKVSRTRDIIIDVATVEFTSRRPLKFQATAPGLTEFLAKVHDTAPQVTIKPPSR
jgi:hypothetical protein